MRNCYGSGETSRLGGGDIFQLGNKFNHEGRTNNVFYLNECLNKFCASIVELVRVDFFQYFVTTSQFNI